VQQGQLFKLKTQTMEGKALWAYRYRLEGRGSARLQVGGFATRPATGNPLRSRPASSRCPVRPAPHLRDLRAARRRLGVCGLPIHGLEHRDDRPPLRPPRRDSREHAVSLHDALAIETGRGRSVDVGTEARKAA
jgi:hypothetical protein